MAQFPSNGPWILDSNAFDHMIGNQSIFSQLSFSDSLPLVTLANGSQIKVHGISQMHLLLHLPLHFVLFVPNCPFNLISISKLTRTLDLSVLFVNKSIFIQDRHIRQMIGVKDESGDYIVSHHRLLVSPPLPILPISVLVIIVWRDYEF
uniref:Retrovirus-related Pol polyprotein from transposon TNT 1-94-like beta-barrel domain-containing protein n=1 Tax=Cajanus cajan TaxID=3821 RepID=A0A151T539_CAJCA|nr:hypothetical protein KK1_016664 [Cajanus cajan]KYP62140.1 hypothetical protein KK1_016665 [Cajanus cajan]